MADIVDKATRSRMMASIRCKDTRPEHMVRKALHALGYRFRLHPSKLPGQPDIVLPRHRVAVLVHGCFWHRHEGCHYATTPGTRVEFWRNKFARNVTRDREVRKALKAEGWRVIVVWECGLKHDAEGVIDDLVEVIRNANIEELELPRSLPRARNVSAGDSE